MNKAKFFCCFPACEECGIIWGAKMTDQSTEEVIAQMEAWDEFKKTVSYRELVERNHPLTGLFCFMEGWRAAKKQVKPMPEEVMTGSDLGL